MTQRIAPERTWMQPCGSKDLLSGKTVLCWECQWKTEDERPKACANEVNCLPEIKY